MEKMRVLVANKPYTYREAITDVLRGRRPRVEVSTIDPEDGLDVEIARLRPQLVVCSEPCDTTEIITLGERTTVEGIGCNDSIIAGDGDDTVYGGNDNDSINRGSGEDRLYFKDSTRDTASGGGRQGPVRRRQDRRGVGLPVD